MTQSWYSRRIKQSDPAAYSVCRVYFKVSYQEGPSCLEFHSQAGLGECETAFSFMNSIPNVMVKRDGLYPLKGMIGYAYVEKATK